MQVPGALLLANPICLARHGVTLEALQGLLARHGIESEAETVVAEPDMLAYRARLRQFPPSRLIVAGGDGTVHQAANMLAGSDVPLGVLPLGTANDFARSLDLPLDLERAVALIAEGAPLPVDLGRVNGHHFLNVAHLGLGVETAKRTNPKLKRLIGPGAYVVAAARALWASEPLTITCCFEGAACMTLTASQLLVGNGRYFGGGLVAGREATLVDGLFDVQILEPEVGPAAALRLARAARHGELEDLPGVFHTRVERFTARLSRPTEVNLDGELVAMEENLAFEVLPGVLGVYAPGDGVRPPGPQAVGSEHT